MINESSSLIDNQIQNKSSNQQLTNFEKTKINQLITTYQFPKSLTENLMIFDISQKNQITKNIPENILQNCALYDSKFNLAKKIASFQSHQFVLDLITQKENQIFQNPSWLLRIIRNDIQLLQVISIKFLCDLVFFQIKSLVGDENRNSRKIQKIDLFNDILSINNKTKTDEKNNNDSLNCKKNFINIIDYLSIHLCSRNSHKRALWRRFLRTLLLNYQNKTCFDYSNDCLTFETVSAICDSIFYQNIQDDFHNFIKKILLFETDSCSLIGYITFLHQNSAKDLDKFLTNFISKRELVLSYLLHEPQICDIFIQNIHSNDKKSLVTLLALYVKSRQNDENLIKKLSKLILHKEKKRKIN
ncbi:hypothetical protein M0811_10919 [Anaeramoeba ignava]|uniref:Uncharacterized protein n=1 Tax=Anaeramoeba ignava TaxID=1746090 RepID=A0A9Q0LCP0_ANAIG|nr:hypothetical protein M0811_10919 [Anaeramoeba ignava]